MRYDPNLHKARILFQDLPINAEYIIKVPKLHTQLVTKFNGTSAPYSQKDYQRNCVVLEDCMFTETIQLQDKPITIPTGHRVDISFPPSFYTKFTECVDAQHLQPHSLGKITFFITNQRAQRGSRKWIITKIERQGE